MNPFWKNLTFNNSEEQLTIIDNRIQSFLDDYLRIAQYAFYLRTQLEIAYEIVDNLTDRIRDETDRDMRLKDNIKEIEQLLSDLKL